MTHLASRFAFSALTSLAIAASAIACSGSTGGGMVTFPAYASGPARDASKPFAFTTGSGYEVTLTRANVLVGGVYLNRTKNLQSERATSCVLPGTYVAQVTSPLLVDALSPEPQAFTTPGEGTIDRAVTGEIWLGAADIQESDDSTVVLDAAGVAKKGADEFPFEVQFKIGKNREVPPKNSALPGSNPICQQRIVSPIAIDVGVAQRGALQVRVDPRGWFDGVDFEELPAPEGASGVRRFVDDNEGQPSTSLYNGLRANTGVYSFAWVP